MSFDTLDSGMQDRIQTGHQMVIESLRRSMAPEIREQNLFESAAASAASDLIQAAISVGDVALPTQAWIALLASAARTVTTASADQVNVMARGLVAILDLTAFVTAASIQLEVQRKNADATYTQLAITPALAAVGKVLVLVDPLAGAEIAGVGDSVSAVLPHEWRVRGVLGNGNSHTFSISGYPIR